MKVENVPGPGQYKASSMVIEMMKKKTSKKGAFGTEATRFTDQSPKPFEEEPGPGQYNPTESIKTLDHKRDSNLKRHSSMFLSKTKREVKGYKAQEDVPSVGTYFPLNDTIADNVRKKVEVGSSSSMNLLYSDRAVIPFASSEIRFKQSRLDENLRFIGPGYYENKTFIENLKLKPSTNLSQFNSKDSRF